MVSRGLRIPRRRRSAAALRPAQGFTLLELMLAGAVGALLLAIAIPSYQEIVERQRVGRCARDLMMISQLIEKHRTTNDFAPPMNLAELGGGLPQRDPWGFDYRYLNFKAGIPGVTGMIRKDHNLHPLNTEFDLYSVGPDGRSAPALTATVSQDDVIWARDGGYVGIARDY